jgi:hypothetical protein
MHPSFPLLFVLFRSGAIIFSRSAPMAAGYALALRICLFS